MVEITPYLRLRYFGQFGVKIYFKLLAQSPLEKNVRPHQNTSQNCF